MKLVDECEVEKLHIKHTIEHLSATPNNRLGDLPHGSKGFRFRYRQRQCAKAECFQCNLLQLIFGEFVPEPAGLGILNFGESAVNTGKVIIHKLLSEVSLFSMKGTHN